MSLVDQVATLGGVLLVFVVGIWLERRTGSPAIYQSLPGWAKVLVGALSFGLPWVTYFRGAFPALPPDPLVWVVALNGLLWIGTPLLLARVVQPNPPAERSC